MIHDLYTTWTNRTYQVIYTEYHLHCIAGEWEAARRRGRWVSREKDQRGRVKRQAAEGRRRLDEVETQPGRDVTPGKHSEVLSSTLASALISLKKTKKQKKMNWDSRGYLEINIILNSILTHNGSFLTWNQNKMEFQTDVVRGNARPYLFSQTLCFTRR